MIFIEKCLLTLDMKNIQSHIDLICCVKLFNKEVFKSVKLCERIVATILSKSKQNNEAYTLKELRLILDMTHKINDIDSLDALLVNTATSITHYLENSS